MLSLDYFSMNIKETEVDSMPLSDTTELLKAELTAESAMEFCAHDEILKISTLPQKLAAWLILLSKYTNAAQAITGFVAEYGFYPVYAEISPAQQSGAIAENVEKWVKEVSELEDIHTFDIDTLIRELELQPMPVLYADEVSFNNASVGKAA